MVRTRSAVDNAACSITFATCCCTPRGHSSRLTTSETPSPSSMSSNRASGTPRSWGVSSVRHSTTRIVNAAWGIHRRWGGATPPAKAATGISSATATG